MIGCTETNCPKTSTARLAAAATTQTAFISLYYLGSLQPATSPSDLLPHLSSQPIPLPVLSSSTPIPLPPIPLPFPSPPPLPNPTLPRRQRFPCLVWISHPEEVRQVSTSPRPNGAREPVPRRGLSDYLFSSPPHFSTPIPLPVPSPSTKTKQAAGSLPLPVHVQINNPPPQWHPQPVPQLPPLCEANSDSSGTRPSSSVRPTYADTMPSIS